jgi:hypothetical protein
MFHTKFVDTFKTIPILNNFPKVFKNVHISSVFILNLNYIHLSTERLQVTDVGDGRKIGIVSADVLNSQSGTRDKGRATASS